MAEGRQAGGVPAGVGNVVVVPLDGRGDGKRRERVKERAHSGDGEQRLRSVQPLVEAIAEEERVVARDVDDAGVGRVVAADVVDHCPGAAQIDHPALGERLGWHDDAQIRPIGQLEPDHVGAEGDLAAVADALGESLVRPVVAGLHGDRGGGIAVRDHGGRERGRAEAVIPVPVGQGDPDDRRPAPRRELGRKRAQVRDGCPALDDQRSAIAVHGPERRPVGAVVRAEPVDVRGDLLEGAVGQGGRSYRRA